MLNSLIHESKVVIMNFDPKRWKVYTWKNWSILFWIINPGSAINELVFGQRVAKLYLEDKTMDAVKFERGFTPCPHCAELHDNRLWDTSNDTALGNWFGLYCRNCGDVIPCVMSIMTFLILLVTSPLWYWFKDGLREKWLLKQKSRYEGVDVSNQTSPYAGRGWVVAGLKWGMFMFVFMGLLFPYFIERSFSIERLLISFVLWLAGGLAFGYMMKVWTGQPSEQVPSH